ncbi:MAG: lysophospholipid acyltransferase family protein, partial [Spirochaetota bacterium]|nr:lysophospholipid acyltransferase family protein [Spirochaetota bacterium]
FKIPIMGWHMKANNYIPVDRSNTREAIKSISEAANQVKNGKRVVIFPEGTRSEDGEIQPFKKGLFHLCAKTGIPILPIYIEGSNKILKTHSLYIHPGNIKIEIGKEIPTAEYSRKNIKTLMNDLRENMIQLQEKARTSINTEKE